MKKKILAGFMLSLLVLPLTCRADEAHHPAGEPTRETIEANREKMDADVRQLREMRNRIEAEQDPAGRKELLRRHMGMMQDTMKMMDMNGGKGMTQEGEPGMMDADMMRMMEKKMEMMLEMMKGMALQQEMIKGSMKQTEEILK